MNRPLKMKFNLLAAIFTTTLYSHALHGMSIDTFEQLEAKDGNGLETYIAGVAEGLAWSNAMLEVRKRKRLYCPPISLALNSQNYLTMLKSAIKKPDVQELPVELILLNELERIFPCEN